MNEGLFEEDAEVVPEPIILKLTVGESEGVDDTKGLLLLENERLGELGSVMEGEMEEELVTLEV